MKNRIPSNRAVPEAVEIELIRSLFHAFLPSSIMTLGFIASGVVVYTRTQDGIMLGLLVAGAFASMARLLVAWQLALRAAEPRLTLNEARWLERRFAIPYLSFAILLGLFGVRAFMLPFPDIHMLTIALLIGYCAGVAVGIGLRLWIAVPSMLISTVPAILVALLQQDAIYWVMSALVAGLLAGGTHSLHSRHGRLVRDIGLRLAFANLARKDALTALPNRIALREWYEERVALGGAGLIAVHYIDLNDFKPVNDSYGHPVGDALLTIVGKRIIRSLRETDIAARLGGDEFAVIQYGINNAEEAEKLAGRLAEAIARPFQIGEHTISISTGLGFVVADGREEDLEHLLGLADQALYASKRAGTIVQYEAVEALQTRAVA
ncbi:GGDEF domain-containing protein [Sphingobium lignivorans]|uniref:Diguanylate cyclase (GGDEF)-like protein n=1 Tax=Sphingobium lignivorans TaxID=2735886 RepID=A0ABR6ND66_9SPHN|nr:GGDEF domain-containing protein [Sphingobium lignivorans]MBB5985199.1 diguanylate cyclase (GGDEF)-like protein [Sphingobium lignivorans]